jgi:hypothetical protein
MTGTFQSHIPALSDAELLRYLARFDEYRAEAVALALAEADRRGLALPADERSHIEQGLRQRKVAAQHHLGHPFIQRLGTTLELRLRRIRQLSASLLAMGLGIATVIYLLATPKGSNPLGYEPEDTKKYLRDLELYGGKVNVLATEFMRVWEALWHGRNLAYTVAVLSVVLALGFWLLATRMARTAEGAKAPSS